MALFLKVANYHFSTLAVKETNIDHSAHKPQKKGQVLASHILALEQAHPKDSFGITTPQV
jgi:hypothetical protein